MVVYPTETVYGIGVDPYNDEAIERVFTLKGREETQALLVLIASEGQLDGLVSTIPPDARSLVNSFWPGPLTLVLPAHDDLPGLLTGGRATVAVRQTASPVAATLIDRLGRPITGTSANRSGHPPALSAEDAAATLGEDVDLILDGGRSSTTTPSTLVDASTSAVSVLRRGPITETAIHDALKI